MAVSNRFDQAVRQAQGRPLQAATIAVIQANLGRRCDLSCRHCHVEASPLRDELMGPEVMSAIGRLAVALPECRVDLTGGAPELNPHFRPFVAALREAGVPVQVRTNLTVLTLPGQEDTPEFLAAHRVKLVASLPCYLEENVAAQRGMSTFSRSIAALRRLNALGYGTDAGLPVDLVYNPGGPFLPPDQARLEAGYRRELHARHAVVFNRLLVIANMPIGRFLQDLQAKGREGSYRSLLRDSFNPQTLDGLMCRHQLCVDWDGSLADCDFNLALNLPLAAGLPRHIEKLVPEQLPRRAVVTGEHCYACTAGCGSSCGGALVA